MLKKIALIVFFIGILHQVNAELLGSRTRAPEGISPIELRCDSRINPLGMDEKNPRLSWELKSSKRGQAQTAYRILVSNSADALFDGSADTWDSGKILSKENINIIYNGAPLQSGRRYFWKVRVWDGEGNPSPWSDIAWWETALLHQSDWRASWIDDGKLTPQREEDFYKDDPAPLFRKAFVADRPIKRARLYISGLGYVEAWLNGQRVGDRLLDPGWTSYGKRVLYSVYDVTCMLQSGDNVIGAVLGNGWYNPLPMRMWGKYNFREHLTVGRPRLIARLAIEYEDGSSELVTTDESWKVGESPILRNNVYLGEVYDARKESPGWNAPGFDDSEWPHAHIAANAIGELRVQSQPPIRATKIVKPVRLIEPKPGVSIFDMGQNFSGWARLRVQGPTGTRVKMRYGELLYADSTLNGMTSVAGQIKRPGMAGAGAPDIAWQQDVYILKGGGEEIYTPRFTFRGFRYIEVTGWPGRPTLADLEGLRLSADVPIVGDFACSNELFNQIYDMSRRTFLSNLFSVQSDCPHREKFGYGGDIVPTCNAFMLNFDMSQFYRKVVRDFGDAVPANDGITETAPFVGIASEGFGGGSGPVGWGIAHPLLQEKLYQFYGDKEIIREQYEISRRWIDFLSAHAKGYIIDVGISDHESLDPKPTALTGTAFYYAAADLTSRLARIIGNENDAEKYTALAQEIKKAFINKFLERGTGRFWKGTQASQAFALYFDLVPPEERHKAVAVLLNAIKEHDGHLATGIFGTKFMIEVLTRYGRADVAYDIVNQKSFPGWGYMIGNGATTLWEHWAFSDNTFSHNHPMFGSVVEWLVAAIAGIRPADDAVGFDRIVVRPEPLGGLTWAQASCQSVRGKISSRWWIAGDYFNMEVSIPLNATAKIYIPAKDEHSVTESGLPAGDSDGLTFLQYKNGRAVYSAAAGCYLFKSLGFY